MNIQSYDSEASNTHIEQIKKHLLSGNEITKLDALRKFGCMNTGDVIFKLRKSPYNLPIETEMKKKGKKRYAIYRLAKKLKQLTLF